MNRVFLFLLCITFIGCTSAQKSVTKDVVPTDVVVEFTDKVELTEKEWRARLDDHAYYVLREKGTERAFTGALLNEKRDGHFTCAGCGLVLFDSKTKFKSGTGWPSFYDTFGDNHVGEVADKSHGMVRTEVVCNRCGGHLGHVFNDGPAPTGLRYCINSVSLGFSPHESEEK